MPTRQLSISMVAGTTDPISARQIADFSGRVESAGYHRLYLTDHIFHSTPSFQSTSAFAVAAASTQSIALGFGAYIVPFRHPIVAAKELAFLDGLCGGRLTAGLAAGSSRLEFDGFGLSFSSRGKRLDESIDAMKRLWTEDAVSFQGEFYQFENVSLTPKPVQAPHPPIWIGSWTGSRPAARRIVKHADGWQASGLHASLEQAVEGWRRVEDMCVEMGRDPASITRSMVNLVTRVDDSYAKALAGVMPSHRMHDELIVAGTESAVVDRLEAIFATGIEEVGLFMPLSALDQVDIIAERVMPQLSLSPGRAA